MTHRFLPLGLALIGLLVACFSQPAQRAHAAETPMSYGEASTVDTPILRVPLTNEPPSIDGVMQPGEWENASALSGFWYDYGQADFRFLAPEQTQLEVYAAYDRENLYLAYSSPVYPENSWLKARARFPDVRAHPTYGLQWDDHIEIEFRPIHDNTVGYNKGVFRWYVNPFNTMADYQWSVNHGERKDWSSKATTRSKVDGERWIIELAIPLESMRYLEYAGTDEDGSPIVDLPIPDGTAYRCWFVRGIGGNGEFFNVFDKHVWNTTKTKMIFDSQAPSFQINELGPIMEDEIRLELTMKNHNTQAETVRSQTVRVGFFVESEEGTIYSSYDAPELNEGLIELVPGQTKKIRLTKPFPGISRNGNVLWFDVRSAGQPAKTLFRTRLIDFHSMDGGRQDGQSFRERRVDVIEEMRPDREPFGFQFQYSPYTKKVAGVVDIGINGADREAKTAKEARLMIFEKSMDEDLVADLRAEFNGNFATLLETVDGLVDGEEYFGTVLLFDESKRIVGEKMIDPFTYREYEWMNNDIGHNDVVWEPYTPIQTTDAGFTTLKHRFDIADSGLPEQIFIQPDPRELPLEIREAFDGDASGLSPELLERIGRGPQLRSPMRIEAVVDGERVPATVVQPAEITRLWQSEIVYGAKLDAAGVPIDMSVQYDCDGAMHVSFSYGDDDVVRIDSLELVQDVAGQTDMKVSTATKNGGMASADTYNCALPMEEGVVWDNADLDRFELYYSRFVPWLWFGSGDRAFTFFSDTDEGWILDRDGSVVTLERDAAGEVTCRIRFVNHTAEVQGERSVQFTLLTHPAKPKPEAFRNWAWFYQGTWADEYFHNHIRKTNEYLANKSMRIYGLESEEALANYGEAEPKLHRYYQLRQTHAETEAEAQANDPNRAVMDQEFEDKFAWHLARHIRVGRRQGFWWDETWPVNRGHNLAAENAYLRDPEEVNEQELPWQETFLTGHMRSLMKRLARVHAETGVPNRHVYWANNSATCFASFGWDTQLVEGCAGGHRSFDLDVVRQYPATLYRYMAHSFTGLVGRALYDESVTRAGDDKRPDRQIMGRAVLHDIGTHWNGPHGDLQHKEQGARLVRLLDEFGYFAGDGQTEAHYYWRKPELIRFGDNPPPPNEGVYITAYRRPKDGGGYKMIMIVMNEGIEHAAAPLHLLDIETLLGGPNTLTREAAYDRIAPESDSRLSTWWDTATADADAQPVLLDLEAGTVVEQIEGETYGPLHVRQRNYRLLYAETDGE